MDRSSSWTNAGRNADYIPPSRVARMAVPSPRPPPGSTAEAVATARRAEYGTGGSILPVLPTAPSASKRSTWTTPRSSSDPIEDDFHQFSSESLAPPPRRAEMASMAATRRAEPVGLFSSDTEQAQLAYMEQMYGTINLLNAELESERRSRTALETAAATRPSTYPVMSDYSSLEEDVQIPVSEFDEPPTGFIVSQTPVASTNSPRKLRTMPSPPSQPPQSQHRVARPPISPRAIVKDQDKELCTTLGKNAELRIRSRDMERSVEKSELELELARKQIKMAERRAENREEKLRALLKEKLNWQKELKATRAHVVEEKMRQVDLFREVEAAKRQFAVELEVVDQELRVAQEENTQLRTHAAEMKAQMNFQARKMEELARQAQDEKARFVAMIEDTRHRFREWKEGEVEALAAAHDQAVRSLKTEYELKMERHQDEKQKLRDKVNDLEVSIRLLQKDRTLSPLELSLRKTAILGSKENTSTIEAEHIETQSRILELENLLAHSQAYQVRQESIIKLSEATISRLMQAREVTALENLSLYPFGVEPQRSEDLLYDTQLTGYVTAGSSPVRPMSPPKTPSRMPQSAGKTNESLVASSPKPRTRRADQEACTVQETEADKAPNQTVNAENSRPSSREKTLMDELAQLRKDLTEAQAKATELAVKSNAHNEEGHPGGDLKSVDMPDSQGAANRLRVVQDESEVTETILNESQRKAQDAEETSEAENAVEHPSDVPTNDKESPSQNVDEERHSDTVVPAGSSLDLSTKESDKTSQNEPDPGEVLSSTIDSQSEDNVTGAPTEETCDASELQTSIGEKASPLELGELVDESITTDVILEGIDSQLEEITATASESVEVTSPVEETCTSQEVPTEPATFIEEITDHALDAGDHPDGLKASEPADEFKTCGVSELPSLDISEEGTNVVSNIATEEEEAVLDTPLEATETLDADVGLEDVSQALDQKTTDGENVLNVADEVPSLEADPASAYDISNDMESNDSTEVQDRDVCSSELETELNSFEQLECGESIVKESKEMTEIAASDLPAKEPSTEEVEGKTDVGMDSCAEGIELADSEVVDSDDPGKVPESSAENVKPGDVSSTETEEICSAPVEAASEGEEAMDPVGSETEVLCLLQEEDVESTHEVLEISAPEIENVTLVADSADSVAETLAEIVERVSLANSLQDSRDISNIVPDNVENTIDPTEPIEPATILAPLPAETPETCVAKELVSLVEGTALSRVISRQVASEPESVEELFSGVNVMEKDAVQETAVMDMSGGQNATDVVTPMGETSPPVLDAEAEDNAVPCREVTETMTEPGTDTAVVDAPRNADGADTNDCNVPVSSEVDDGVFVAVDEPPVVNDGVCEMSGPPEEQQIACDELAGLLAEENDPPAPTENSVETNEDAPVVAVVTNAFATNFVKELMEMLDSAPSISENQEIDGAGSDANTTTDSVDEAVAAVSVRISTIDISDPSTSVKEDSSPMVDVSSFVDATETATTEEMAQSVNLLIDEVVESSGSTTCTVLDDAQQIDDESTPTEITTIARDFVDSVEVEALSSVTMLSLQNESSDETKIIGEHEREECESESTRSNIESSNLPLEEQNEPAAIISETEAHLEPTTEVPASDLEEQCSVVDETIPQNAVEEAYTVESNSSAESNCTNNKLGDSASAVEIAQIIQDSVEAVENEMLAVSAANDSMREHSDDVEAPVLGVEESIAPIRDEFSTHEIVSCMACIFVSHAIAVALSRLSQSCDPVQDENIVSGATDVEVVEESKSTEEPCTTEVELEVSEAQQKQAAADEPQRTKPSENGSTQPNDDSIVPDATALPSNFSPEESLVVEELLPTSNNVDNVAVDPNDKVHGEKDANLLSLDDISTIESTIRNLVDAVENCDQVETESGSGDVNDSKTPDDEVDQTNDVLAMEEDSVSLLNLDPTTESSSSVQVSDKAADADFIQAKQVEVEASESLGTNSSKMEDTDKHDEIELYAATRFRSSLEDDAVCLTVETLVDAIVAATDTSSVPSKVDPGNGSTVARRCAPKHARSVRFAGGTKEEQPDRLNVARRSVLLWQAPNDKACAKEAVETSAKRRASKRRTSRRTIPDLLAFPTEMARFTASDTTLLAYDARHEQGNIFSLLDQSILTIDPNGRHIDLDDSDERVQSKIIGKRKTLTQEIHSKNLALRQIPRFNYMPMRIKFQWSDFVVATPVRPSNSNLGEGRTMKPPVEPMRLLQKKGAKLPCGSYVIVSAFIRPLEDGNENLRVQIYDAERVEEFQFDFSEDIMKKYHLEKMGMEAQALEFLGHLEFRRDEDTIIIKLPEKKAGEGSKTDVDRIQSELTMVGGGDPRKRDLPPG
ncbi:hypothetical protein Pcac1_g8661 [Phytophthora cactorum]|uniref:Uncharacterized protein n=4 Tax=Phytophthora cactorum TaxID=29920 RepID=A0A329SFM9_9STRA|nr:hypothetical protein Pcac1_g8661 [Phytophthora cactorum]KAG2898869.1 hypothetical protein PC114_g14111 [Phytophthora cactorum]KAG2907949.1 hypothetical protein PC115_g13697 [Phytophthora cactorum]KAG3077396.1 hypothetical protein PC122_g13180 [Phytophthora cactorum]RAW34458.1 hypothetical protein PC110_g9235 [Phytophthora cactorum]